MKSLHYPGAIAVAVALLFALSLMTHLRSPRVNAGAQLQLLNKFSLADAAGDFPAGFELYTEGSKETRDDGPANRTRRLWHGERFDPSKPVSPQNKALEGGQIRIFIAKTASDAVSSITPGKGAPYLQISPLVGSYSGKRIGDSCMHGGAPDSSGAALWFTRGSVAYTVFVNGPSAKRNWVDVAESIALSLVERADAALALASSPDGTIQVDQTTLSSKVPNGVTIVDIRDYAQAAGADCSMDLIAGKVTLTRGIHTLKLNVGRTEASLDGSSITLPFPALRNGKDQAYCPLDTLRKLGP